MNQLTDNLNYNYKMVQAEIAHEMGVSQSYVSRLLRKKVKNPKREKQLSDIINRRYVIPIDSHKTDINLRKWSIIKSFFKRIIIKLRLLK